MVTYTSSGRRNKGGEEDEKEKERKGIEEGRRTSRKEGRSETYPSKINHGDPHTFPRTETDTKEVRSVKLV